MPTEEFDFDPQNSDLNIGLEVEYPGMQEQDEYLISRGRSTTSLQRGVDSMLWPGNLGRPVHDGTVGLEVVSNVLDLADAANWYRDVIEHVEQEHNTPYQPTGLMSTGNTAGLHMHLSSLSRSKAEDLYEISQTPWAKILFCTSIASHDDNLSWPVFRGGRYCQMQLGAGHYDVVNERGGGHYEWRLPEPVVPGHMEIIARFLRLFEQSTDAAIEYAQEILDDADERLTSVQRAEAVGMEIDEMPEVRREPFEDTRSFYETVEQDWWYPEIYQVSYDGRPFYLFESRLDGPWEVNGVTFTADDVLYADELDVVEDETYTQEVWSAYTLNGTEDTRETEATEELKKIIKKKKSI